MRAEDSIEAGPNALSLSLCLLSSRSLCCVFILQCGQGRETEIFARMEIGPSKKGLGFAVDRPADDLIAQSTVKRAMAGMMFQKDFSKLPGTHAGVIWEAMCDMNPPVMIRPVKPKFWLLGKITIDAGTLCQLH